MARFGSSAPREVVNAARTASLPFHLSDFSIMDLPGA
jgi:hypothetical protein